MKLLTAKANHPNKQIFSLENLVIAERSGQPLQDILDGKDMLNPIEVKKHVVSDKPRSGANGIPYLEKEFSYLLIPLVLLISIHPFLLQVLKF